MQDPINVFIITATVTTTVTSALWAYFIWHPNENKTLPEKEEKTTEIKLPLPARYFYCIQNREELPEWDPMLFAAELYRDARERADKYLQVDFPLAMTTGDKTIARQVYQLDNRNFTHISATLNQMIFTLNNLGKSYPDVLQISYKIGILRLEIDHEAKNREFICAANLFPRRFKEACTLARGGVTRSSEIESLTLSEVKSVFLYSEDELLF